MRGNCEVEIMRGGFQEYDQGLQKQIDFTDALHLHIEAYQASQ